MDVDATTVPAAQTGAETLVEGVWEGEKSQRPDARAGLGKLASGREGERRWIAVGLGKPADWDAERAREAAAAAYGRARELGATHLAWDLPDAADAGPVVEGTLLSAYRFRTYKRPAADEDRRVERLTVCAAEDASAGAARAAVLADAQNACRDLQNIPANDMTPQALAARARELAAEHGLAAEILGPAQIEAAGMGAFASVAHGSVNEPRLIALTYEHREATGPLVGLVGKAVTFDSGGYSLKGAAKMHEMKFDMSGGAAVLEAVGALARLGARARVLAVVGATENLVSGSATRPGDIVRSLEGLTIEVDNTDAEGRLVLADCLTWARRRGVERIVDIATLTGGIVTALGSVHAGLMANDDGWAAEVEAAAASAGELVWRMPLHKRYVKAMEGRYADLRNAAAKRAEASPLTAAGFLSRFTEGVPWAHLDIAGMAWDAGLPYASTGGSGWGVRTLVELSERSAA